MFENNRVIFLKPSRGTMSISTTFKDILVSDTALGCRLNIRLGRLDCSTAPYNIKLSATTSVFTTNGVIKFT